MKIVVHKLQETILHDIKRDAQPQPCFAPSGPNFPTLSQDVLNDHIAKKHSVPRPSITCNCKLCHADFPGFYALPQHKNTQNVTQIGFGASNIDVEDIVGDVDDQNLREEMESCKYILSDTEMENGRRRFFNFAMSSFDIPLLNDKLDYVFKELRCAAKLNLAFGFVLKNIEDGMCRYFYAHENNTVMEKSKLVCTPDDIVNLREKIQKMDNIDLCTQQRANTKWKFYKLTNVTDFAALLKNIPMGCKDTVLPEPLLKNHYVNCLTFERNTRQPYNDNLCLFRALALHLHGNDEKLEEETSKNFNLFLNNSEEGEVANFQGVHLNDIPKDEDLLQLNIFLYEIDFADGELTGEVARKSIQKYEKSVKLLRYNNHMCYVNNINALFKAFRCTTCDTFFSKTGNLERYLVTCTDHVEHVYPKNVYELRETLFQKLDAFNIPYKIEQKLFKNLTIFHFQSTCVKEDSFKQTETTTWIGKHVPISVSISSNVIQEPIFLCNANPHHLISSFITALEGLATQSKA